MKRRHAVELVSALIASFALSACGSSLPIVASKFESEQALEAAIQAVGLCAEGMRFQNIMPEMVFTGMDPRERVGSCGSDDLSITFFPPSAEDFITVTWPLFLCGSNDDGADTPLLIGLNWTIVPSSGQATEAFDKAASATNGTVTTASAALKDFCDAVKSAG